MARAFKGAIEYRITADRDLGDSFAVALIPVGPVSPPRVMKLVADGRAEAIEGVLRHFEALGDIDKFELD